MPVPRTSRRRRDTQTNEDNAQCTIHQQWKHEIFDAVNLVTSELDRRFDQTGTKKTDTHRLAAHPGGHFGQVGHSAFDANHARPPLEPPIKCKFVRNFGTLFAPDVWLLLLLNSLAVLIHGGMLIFFIKLLIFHLVSCVGVLVCLILKICYRYPKI